MSERVREPAVAGLFYPADSEELRRVLVGFLGRVGAQSSCGSPKAIVVPHAGYVYSAPIAASAYARIDRVGITRVVLLGPSHRVFFEGLAAPEAAVWRSPLGALEIDAHAMKTLARGPQVQFSDAAHELEHSLEVQLPFLQATLDEFTVVPLLVGNAPPCVVADVLDALWGGSETLIVVSSDLSHYDSYEHACRRDRITAQAIASLDLQGVESDSACGLIPLAGLVASVRKRGGRAELLDLRNSGDTAGSRESVVGYGAFAFYE